MVVFVESSQVSYHEVKEFPPISELSIYITFTDDIVPLLYLMFPVPGSESVVVVLKLYLTPP